MVKKRIGILTGGGDVQPLNAVISSVRNETQKYGIELCGFKYGWKGLIENDFIILNDRAIDPQIGGTLLKSSRINLSKIESGSKVVLENLAKLGIEGLIVIGGEDTLSNSFLINDFPQVLISKTIDNDVGIINENEILNYFTLGHPTAAEKISSFVSLDEGLRTTAYSHERIIIVESMGMHAGWLALSSSMGHPDFIILPEFGLDYNSFVERIADLYKFQKHIIVVIAEGARWSNEKYISADESEKDSFGHPRFKGASIVLANLLKSDLQKYFDTRNVNSVNPSYLYRSGKPNLLDLNAATEIGKEAVNYLAGNGNESIFITTSFDKDTLQIIKNTLSDYKNIDDLHRFVTKKFYDPEKQNVTIEGKEFLSKMINEHPQINYRY